MRAPFALAAPMPSDCVSDPIDVAVIGGGPAGLMAAEVARAAGRRVTLFEALGSVGRKFLVAGKGGLNLTHSEPFANFAARYGARRESVSAWLREFDADALREWARGLGVETFVGSSGRVFPRDLKAAPLLRGWVRELRERGLQLHMRHRWIGWSDEGALQFLHDEQRIAVRADATVLALGGGSWPQLGSDGRWVDPLENAGIALAPLQPANCGFDCDWSPVFSERFAGTPLKPVLAHWVDADGTSRSLQGECVITATGVEGSLIYALSARLRDSIAAQGQAVLVLDLLPGLSEAQIVQKLQGDRGKRSFSEHLRRRLGLDALRIGLLRERFGQTALQTASAAELANGLKRHPLRLLRTRPLAEAISTAGGVRLEALDAQLMSTDRPGLFCAGEMLDWEAPTGGYLLTACLASGLIAGRGAACWLQSRSG